MVYHRERVTDRGSLKLASTHGQALPQMTDSANKGAPLNKFHVHIQTIDLNHLPWFEQSINKVQKIC